MAADCSYLRSSTAFTTVRAPYGSAYGSGLLIPPLVNGFHDGFRAVFLIGWQRIAHSSASQRLSRQFARRIAPRMVADSSYFRSSTAFTTVRAPYCSVDGSGLLIPPLVNVFPDGSCAVLLSGWRQVAHSFSRQLLSRRFARRIAQRMAAHCSFFRSSTAFPTVFTPYCSAVGSALLIPPLVNGISTSSRAVLLSGWQRIAHSSARQRLFRRFVRRIAQRMGAHCSFFLSSTAFPTVRAPYCSADGRGLLVLSLVNGFHDGCAPYCSADGRRLLIPPLVNGYQYRSCAIWLSGWHQIAHSSTRQRHLWFARHFALRMVADSSYLWSSMAFNTVCTPYCSVDGSGLLNGWQRIPRSSARQRLSLLGRCFAHGMIAHCSYFRSSTAVTACAPCFPTDGSGLLILPLVNGFHDGLRAVLLLRW